MEEGFVLFVSNYELSVLYIIPCTHQQFSRG